MKAIQYFLTVQLSPGQVLLAVLVLALVFVAFLPTLLVDYVPQDQWRAFRYSLANEGTGARLQACVNLIPSFYVATGRPLVWLGECAEHAFVGFIADFRSLRPFCLLMVFVTLLLLARALRPLFDDPVLAIVTSAMVLYSPGYTFMYFQGLTGTAVILGAILGILSFLILLRVDFSSMRAVRKNSGCLVSAIVLFLLACYHYPAFAFISVALAGLYAAFDSTRTVRTRTHRWAAMVLVYGIASGLYVITSKAVIGAYFSWTQKPFVDLGTYSFEISYGGHQLVGKMKKLLAYFSHQLPLSSYLQCPAFVRYGIALGIVLTVARECAKQKSKWAMAYRCGASLFGLIIAMLAMVAPALAGGTTGVPHRHAFTWQLVMVVAGVVLASRLLHSVPRLSASLHTSLIVVLLFLPATARQLKSSLDQVMQSDAEIRILRMQLKRLVSEEGIGRIRRLHVVRPIRGLNYAGQEILSGEGDLPASAANPLHIYQMVTAVLRELLPPESLRELNIYDCNFDGACVEKAMAGGQLVLSQSEAGESIPIGEDTAVVDFTLGQVQFSTQAIRGDSSTKPERITASRETAAHPVRRGFDNSTGADDFWEATAPFPIFLDALFRPAVAIREYEFSCGDVAERMPRAWKFFGSNDAGKTWTLLDDRKEIDAWKPFTQRKYALAHTSTYGLYRFDFEEAFDPNVLRVYEARFRY